MSALAMERRNPDVLDCISNLSNDEVFTPPELANKMLDMVAEAWATDHDGANIWADPTVRFLDPFTKSGVFLRQITERLVEGLATQYPDLQERVDHILTEQVFGIAITELTALLARRSLYCSREANSKHSVTKQFHNADGHIWFEPTQHTWVRGRCKFCGASQDAYSREDGLETHAYAFIHNDDAKDFIKEIFGEPMQFDIVIGNPPYQLGSDGGTRDIPIYQKFVNSAKQLDPRYLAMIIPSRWMASGLGLTEFRAEMLADNHIKELYDFPISKDVFPNVEVKGGVCYFLRDTNEEGKCLVTTTRGNDVTGPLARKLDEYDVFVRDGRAVSILKKVLAKSEKSINTILSVDKEFGWTSNFDGFHLAEQEDDVPIYYIRKTKRAIGYISRDDIFKSQNLIDSWKVLVPQAGSGGGQVPDYVVGKPLIAPNPSVCTQSFLFFYVDSKSEAESIESYYGTKFLRFLVSLRKITQHATRSTYEWVPLQTWDRVWTDKALYEKYGLTEKEIEYIDSQISAVDWAVDDGE